MLKNVSNFKKALLLIAFVFIIVQLGIAAYLLINILDVTKQSYAPGTTIHEKNERVISEVNTAVSEQLQNIPSGLAQELADSRIYFMLTAKDDLHPQTYVFENGSFSDPQKQGPDGEDKYDTYYGYSRDGSKAAFFAVDEKLNTDDTWGNQAKLFVANVEAGNSVAFPSLDAAAIVDDTKVPHKQHPSVSNAGDVLFNGWEGSEMPEVEASNDWSIYIVKDGAAQFLTNGFMPKWISDTEFLFLKNDGLYLANTDMSVVRRIGESSEETVLSNNRFDISNDGKLLVWTQPFLPTVFVYEIQEDYSLQLKNSILAKSFWVQFSPSSKYLALQAIDLYAGGKEDNPKAKIEFYDMATFAKVPELEINFEGFNQLYMFMNDWALK